MRARDPDSFFCDKTLLPGQGHGPLAHHHHMLTLVLHGRLDEEFADGAQRCRRWELHFKPGGSRHSTSTGPAGVRMLLLGLRGPALEGQKLPDRPHVLGGGVPAARALGAFASIARSRHERQRVDRDAVNRLIDCLEHSPDGADSSRPAWITEAHERIHEEDTRRARLEQLAHQFRVHPVYLARAFRKHYGISIGALRRRIRVDRAIELTANGTSLVELAHDLGYADQSHLTREFKQETGWSPGRFRSALANWGRIPRD